MAKPLVAVVGRPNVGKSTLFNAIVNKRISIVEDIPGVTRDRIYFDAEWLNREFTMIDTGGIEFITENSHVIPKMMRLQAELAIEEADVILFVVDGKQGIVPADEEVANILRASGKPVVLVVNKIDSVNQEPNIYEFYNLGLGDPIGISAKNLMNLGDLLDDTVKHFPPVGTNVDDEDTIHVAIIGRPNVGKSTLMNIIGCLDQATKGTFFLDGQDISKCSENEMSDQVSMYFDTLGELEEKDQEAIQNKYQHILEHLDEIDQILNEYSRGWKTTRMNRVDLTALRLAVYEMKMDEEVPVGVAINEAVELAKLFGGEDSGSFVNGILGKIASGKKDSGEEHKKPRRQTHSAKIIIRSSKKDGKASKDQKNPERASEESTE